MLSFTKTALSVIGVAGCVMAAWADITNHSLPPWSALSAETQSHITYQHKYVGKYIHYFVGASDSVNDLWWAWSFQNVYVRSKVKDEGFRGISTWQLLKDTCRGAYAAGEHIEEGGIIRLPSGNHRYGLDGLWSYCSYFGQKPKTIDDAKDTHLYASKQAEGRTGVLMAVNTKDNDRFWEIRNKEFYGYDGLSKILVDPSHKYFMKKQQQPLHTRKSIKDLCKDAYQFSDSNKEFTKESLVNYCSLDIRSH